jgi:FKBP-type peptidyl-prolyl cis-trans isomerase 2
MSVVQENNTVKAHYKGTLSNGQLFDNSEGREPLEFTIGKGQLIPGFENAVIGMKVGETKSFEIPSEEAYGAKRDDLFYEIPKANIPEHIKPEEGMQLTFESPEQGQMLLTVVDVQPEIIKVDANHPLAGEDLKFEVTIVDIQ